ncbi:hypothetical protein ABE137_11205 [Brevibacillus laterosporus]|uniref:hypothetical protein n=1 Tax=Brevibacillus laterosporus TaxID=1465 RepID=UPI003D1FA85B
MYSLPQLQALDYLLKKITTNDSYPLYQKELKFVIEFNNSLWYGDFVQMEGNSVIQETLDDNNEIDISRFTPSSNSNIFLRKIWQSYISEVASQSQYIKLDPFKSMKSLPLLFDSLIKLLYKANIFEEKSPLFPYLLNATSLDHKVSLPFINLENETIKLISIIEIKH